MLGQGLEDLLLQVRVGDLNLLALLCIDAVSAQRCQDRVAEFLLAAEIERVGRRQLRGRFGAT